MPVSADFHRCGSVQSGSARRSWMAFLFGAVIVLAAGGPVAAQTETAQTAMAIAHLQERVTRLEGMFQQLERTANEERAKLEARIDDLEKKLDGPLTVQAPFVVTDGKTPILQVVAAAGGGDLTLRSGGVAVGLRATASEAKIVVNAGGGSSAQLIADGARSGIEADFGDDFAQLTAGRGARLRMAASGQTVAEINSAAPSGHLLSIADGSGQQIFTVGSAGGGAELRVIAGASVATLRAVPESADIFAQAGGNLASISADGKESEVVLTHGGNMVELTADDGARVSFSAGGKTVAAMGSPSAEGHNLMIADGSGQPMFTVGSTGDIAEAVLRQGEGLAKLQARSAGNAIVSVGTGERPSAMLSTDGTASSVAAYQGEDIAQLGFGADGPSLDLIFGGNLVAELGAPAGKKTGLRLYDSGGRVILHAGLGTQGFPGVSLWRNDDAVALIEALPAGDGKITLFKSGGTEIIRLGPKDDWHGLHVLDGDKTKLFVGREVNGSYSLGLYGNGGSEVFMWLDDGNPVFEIQGAGSKPELRLGKFSGKPSALRIFDEAGNVAIAAGIGGGTPTVYVAQNGVVAAKMSAHSGALGSVSVFNNDAHPVASINSADHNGQGLVVVRNDSGTAVAHLIASDTGGNLTVTDPGGDGVFSAGAVPGGGEACVNRAKSGRHCLGIGLPLR